MYGIVFVSQRCQQTNDPYRSPYAFLSVLSRACFIILSSKFWSIQTQSTNFIPNINILFTMRILLLSACFLNNSTYFEEICAIVRFYLEHQNVMVDTELQIIIRQKNEIEDFIFEIDTSKSSKQSMKNFENLDLIFIVGDNKLYPWSRKLQEVNIFIRMCFRLNKNAILITGSVMEILIVALNSKSPKNVQLINGTKGSPLFNIKRYLKNSSKAKYFFDSIHGDLYSYNNQNSEWHKYSNCGIANLKEHREFYKNSKFKTSAPLVNQSSKTFNKTRSYEYICSIVKKKSYLVEGIKSEFVVQKSSVFGILPSQLITVIGKGETGPMIIERGNLVGVHFQISSRYPQAVLILKNFIYDRLDRIINVKNDEKSGQNVLKVEKYLPSPLEYPPKQLVQKLSLDMINFQQKLHLSKTLNVKTKSNIKQSFWYSEQSSELNNKIEIIQFKRDQIRKLLHPTLQFNPRKPIWIPGDLNNNKMKGIRIKTSNALLKSKSQPFEFKAESIFIEQTFKQKHRINFEQNRKKKKKILGNDYFKTGLSNNNFKIERIQQINQKHPNLHRFREQDNNKWISLKGFRV